MQKKDNGVDLEKVITKYRSVISFRVRKSLGTYNPDWEDVVNEIITNVIEKVKKGEFRGDSSIGTFIYTITSRRIVDYIRQKSKVRPDSSLSVLVVPPHTPWRSTNRRGCR